MAENMTEHPTRPKTRKNHKPVCHPKAALCIDNQVTLARVFRVISKNKPIQFA